jgi:Rrf2 family protein
MVALAEADPHPLITSVMASTTKVPPGYLPKVLQTLRKARLVESKRGLNGGFTLARHPEDISILEVINAVDPLKRIERCPLGLERHATYLCPLHRRLDDAMAVAERTFAASSLTDLLKTQGGRPALCSPDRPASTPVSIGVALELD